MKKDNSKERLFEVMSKLDKTFKPKLNELDINTYAKQMDTTSDYPWTKNISGDYGDRGKGAKQGRVNKLSREGFLREFNKEFPKGMKIQTTIGEFDFHSLKFDSNYTGYDLIFQQIRPKDNWEDFLWIRSNHGSGFSVDKTDNNGSQVKITDPKSIELINSMMRYNLSYRAEAKNNPQ